MWLLLLLEADEEAFEDNPEEYIRRDIEGSGLYATEIILINYGVLRVTIQRDAVVNSDFLASLKH